MVDAVTIFVFEMQKSIWKEDIAQGLWITGARMCHIVTQAGPTQSEFYQQTDSTDFLKVVIHVIALLIVATIESLVFRLFFIAPGPYFKWILLFRRKKGRRKKVGAGK